MTSIRSFADILADQDAITDDQSKYFLGIIHNESIRLTRLLDEILDIGVLERGEDLPVSKINPRQALARAVDACRGLAASAQITIEDRSTAGPAITVLANADRVTQVFINIISNAIKYNAAGTRITIEDNSSATSFTVTVSDTGRGIAPNDVEKIFDKFSRGSTPTTEKGAGLGLSISRAIMRQFGGDVRLLDSDVGARFEVSLPGAKPSEA